MKLTKRYQLNITRKDKNNILKVMKEAAYLWNDLIKINSKLLEEGKYPTAPILQKEVQGKYNLHSDILIALCQRLESNIKTSKQNKKINKNTKEPYKIKKDITLTCKKRQILKNNNISLSKEIKIKIPDYINLSDTSFFHIKKMKNQYYIYITEEKIEEPIKKEGVTASIDLGEIHSIASIDENGNKYLISNRVGRSFKRYRNKKYKKIQSLLDNCKKDSNRYKQLKEVQNKIGLKTNNKLKNIYHHTSKKIIEKFSNDKVNKIVIGDCRGVEKNTKKDKKLNKESRQKISQFSYSQLIDYIKYKAMLKGIQTELEKENWTTQTCPRCNNRYKPSGRNYVCKECGFEFHRDFVGCFNILRKRIDVKEPLLQEGFIIGIYPIKVSTERDVGFSSRCSGLEPKSIINIC